MVLAREVGQALGYADNGSKFVESIREWSLPPKTDGSRADLREGEHWVKVCGPLFAAWLAEGGATMTATEVLAFADARGLLCEETRGDTPHARVTRLGVLLRERTASPVAGYRLSARRHHGNVAHYSLRAS